MMFGLSEKVDSENTDFRHLFIGLSAAGTLCSADFTIIRGLRTINT